MIKVAFYDAQAYDKPSFEACGQLRGVQFRFLETKLNEDTAELARGCDPSYFEKDGICDNELCYRCRSIERCKKDRKERCF